MDQRDDFVRTSLRIPKALYDAIGEAAGRKRSLNAEIVQRLEASFTEPMEMSDEGSKLLLDELRIWRSEALELRKERDRLSKTAEKLSIDLSRASERIAQTDRSMLPTFAPESFDALIAEVRATREAVRAIEKDQLARMLDERFRELKDDKAARAAFIGEVQRMMRLAMDD